MKNVFDSLETLGICPWALLGFVIISLSQTIAQVKYEDPESL